MATILIVEDDSDIRYVVSDKLNKGGFGVIDAADGVAALQQRVERALPKADR